MSGDRDWVKKFGKGMRDEKTANVDGLWEKGEGHLTGSMRWVQCWKAFTGLSSDSGRLVGASGERW
jgi:hypothetical protein